MLHYSKSDDQDDAPPSIPAYAIIDEQSNSSYERSSMFDNLGDIMATPMEGIHIPSVGPELNNQSKHKSITKYNQCDGRSHHSGLVTSTSSDGKMLNEQFHVDPPFSALDRIILTANGNLQRIISSYYDAPVEVKVISCKERTHLPYDDAPKMIPGIWDRKVELEVSNVKFCTAISEITVHEARCADLVRSGELGLGQLFRYLDKLPTFDLLNAGRTPEGGIWRLYELKSEELTCSIFEEFSSDVWLIN